VEHTGTGTNAFVEADNNSLTWSGVRLKPIAPIVFAWAQALRALGFQPLPNC
jgi:hypothetical protein